MDYDLYDALLHHIFKQTQGDAWFKPSEENVHAGVCLRIAPAALDTNTNGNTAHGAQFRVFPYDNHHLEPFEAAVRALNPVGAVKVRSAAVHAALACVTDDAEALYVDVDTRIQILNTMSWLPRADKEQRAAFIRDERVLVVWAYTFDDIIPTVRDFEEKLINFIVAQRNLLGYGAFAAASAAPSALGSAVSLGLGKDGAVITEKEVEDAAVAHANKEKIKIQKMKDKNKNKKSRGCLASGLGYFVSSKEDVEKTAEGPSARPIRLLAPFNSGIAVGLSIFFVGSGIATLITEVVLDGSFTRLALLVTAPFLFCVSLFFSMQIIANVGMIIGPVSQFHQNSKYYSAIPAAPNKLVDSNLPHVSIEMPVYKESLKETITPSVNSLKKAMQTYARQGGTSSIFVHDDGMQLISEEDRLTRIAFYSDNNIGWVARPPHSSADDGYKRAGRFKKASNMNYGLALSLKLEKHLATLIADAAAHEVDIDDDDDIEDRALELAVEETYQESGQRWRPWAANGRSLRLGEVILIVDSDTIVPEDCFRDAARELAECPEVAIVQHESDVMQVAHHYFENGIAHFTRRINKCISLGCANGEVAPFVGHNAFLRWSAVQEAAFVDKDDGVKKIWSESNVSEDFDMALRLQLCGYIIRWATYSEGGFKEGVSLTCDDELNRWQKYAYGCNELIFHPLIDWWRMGPITKQLRVFIWSGAPIHYKFSMLSYMFSYYGLAGAAFLSVLNYFLLGWSGTVDGFYLHSFEVWLACTVIFPGAGNIGFTLLEYRLGQRQLLASLIENLSWVPFFFFFFGGLSIHLSQALLAHLFSYNITWGATKKEVERSNFWLEVPKILKRFWFAFALCIVICAAMVILTTSLIPAGWQIPGVDWALILPLAITAGCHILFPIVLNPWFMIFSY